MKQVYYSELTNKYYDSEEECTNAEKEIVIEKEKEEKKKNEISIQKKALASAIDEADKGVSAAYSSLEIAYTEANKILKEAREKANKIVEESKNNLKEAQQKKFEAVSEFNKKFGVYTTTYSGDRALEELRRANSWINDIFKGFFF